MIHKDDDEFFILMDEVEKIIDSNNNKNFDF